MNIEIEIKQQELELQFCRLMALEYDEMLTFAKENPNHFSKLFIIYNHIDEKWIVHEGTFYHKYYLSLPIPFPSCIALDICNKLNDGTFHIPTLIENDNIRYFKNIDLYSPTIKHTDADGQQYYDAVMEKTPTGDWVRLTDIFEMLLKKGIIL